MLFTLSFAFSSYAAFMDIGSGARPSGMGKAFVAISDDVNALHYNPAGLVQVQKFMFLTTYTRLYVGVPGLAQGEISYVYPLSEYSTLAGGWDHLIADSSSASYRESIISLALAYSPTKYAKIETHEVNVGLKLKLLNKKYGENEYTSANSAFANKTSAWGYTADISLLIKPIALTNNLTIGLSAENLTQPDVSVNKEDIVPMLFRAGVSSKLLESVTGNLEYDWRKSDYSINTGVEFSIKDPFEFAARGGYSIGNNKYSNASVGFGVKLPMDSSQIGIDYAFIIPFNFMNDVSGTHRISLSFIP